MKKAAILLLFIQVFIQQASYAHRLNEYLEAITISVAKNHVLLELRLTPGTDVASKVLGSIDLNADGTISKGEQLAYVSLVNHDLALTVDGQCAILKAMRFIFPTNPSIRQGTGDIVITYMAPIALLDGSHHLELQNHHQSTIAVYLVNCLMPDDSGIHVTGQGRSYDQSVYKLDYYMGSLPAVSKAVQHHQDDFAVVNTYFFHGVKHILTGYDHLLFLAGLVLGAASLWELVKVVTAFTIAHSLTLTLAVLHLVQLPENLVETMIAASIVFVAVQNILYPGQAGGSTRLIVAFIFGLFHGLGFAGGLLEVMHQMPRETVVLAIIGFTIGIETGNQLVLLPLFGALRMVCKLQPQIDRQHRLSFVVRCTGSALVAIAGSCYLCLALVYA